MTNKNQSSKESLFIQSICRYLIGTLQERVLKGGIQFKLCTNSRYRIQKLRYNSPANPYKIIHVDPQAISHNVSKFSWWRGLGQIHDGNWDKPEDKDLIKNSPRYTGLKQRFEEGREWRNTDYYEHIKKKFIYSDNISGYNNLNEFEKVRLNYIDQLFQEIRDSGYRPNRAAEHNVPDQDKRASSNWYHSRLEPLVSIGRNGNIYFYDGFHRIVLAKLLDLDSIPVNVIARHRDWQKVREGRSKMEIPSNDQHKQWDNHPDLTDI